MFARRFELLGTRLSTWDAAFVVGALAGYVVLEIAFYVARPTRLARPRLLILRYVVTVYVAVLGAQLAAYAFDLHTTLLPPWGVTWQRYYLNPFYGPKTLFGAVIVLPAAVLLVAPVPWRRATLVQALDRWTPALITVLAGARLGCFLEGCCYGIRSTLWGIRFAPEAVVTFGQVHAGLIEQGSASLPVIPTQALSAGVLLLLCLWSLVRLRRGDTGIYPDTIAAYSLFRFVIEFVRDDEVRNFLGPLSTSQWIAISILVTYGLMQWMRREQRARQVPS